MKETARKILTSLAVLGVLVALIMVFVKDPDDRVSIILIFGSVYCILQLMT
jgi:hypothetical protein